MSRRSLRMNDARLSCTHRHPARQETVQAAAPPDRLGLSDDAARFQYRRPKPDRWYPFWPMRRVPHAAPHRTRRSPECQAPLPVACIGTSLRGVRAARSPPGCRWVLPIRRAGFGRAMRPVPRRPGPPPCAAAAPGTQRAPAVPRRSPHIARPVPARETLVTLDYAGAIRAIGWSATSGDPGRGPRRPFEAMRHRITSFPVVDDGENSAPSRLRHATTSSPSRVSRHLGIGAVAQM